MDTDPLTELTLKSLWTRFMFYRDTAQWDKARACWHPDPAQTRVKISWITGTIDAFLAGCQSLLAAGGRSWHTVQPIEATVIGSKAVLISTGLIAVRIDIDGVECEIHSFTRFLNGFVRDETDRGKWKLVSFEAIYDRDSIVPTGGGQIPRVELPEGARDSYKYMDWVLSRGGRAVAKDLPGLDDAASVERVMGEFEAWLRS